MVRTLERPVRSFETLLRPGKMGDRYREGICREREIEDFSLK